MIEKKIIANAKYIAGVDGENSMVSCTINGVGVSVPLDPDNTDYAAILEWVAKGNTIQDAD
jgi:hypothetical protein|tara:strand:+ start:303 stop:485 length:183 start_codon:yes stop_codon:yes gene_type:complete